MEKESYIVLHLYLGVVTSNMFDYRSFSQTMGYRNRAVSTQILGP